MVNKINTKWIKLYILSIIYLSIQHMYIKKMLYNL